MLFLYLLTMEYKLSNERVVFDDHYKMMKAQVRYDTFAGKTIETTRLAFERGDSVAIVLFEKDTQCILLTRQFRYPSTKHGLGWVTEIPAGSLERGESPEKCVVRETKEEVGYAISEIEHLTTFYVSPGGCTERCHLYYAEVTQKDQTAEGGGKLSENEDIKIIKQPVSALSGFLKEKCNDGKTLIGLQWFLLHKATS